MMIRNRRPHLSAASPRFKSWRSGFSLVELLVVIGIIAILISLAVVGFKVVGSASKEKVTVNQLENARSLLNEYELTSSAADLLSPYPSGSNDWLDPTDVTKTKNVVYGRRASASTANKTETARVMSKLRAVPKNRASLEAMAGDRVENVTFATLGALPAGQAPVLLDGSGQPIYFVPGGGLTGVSAGDQTNLTIRAPDSRPFWASAGPDGNLSTGDDNIYSFGK